MYGVGVIYGVLGCLALTNAQQYYNQADYYKQFPQYAQQHENSYHGYSTPSGIKSNANSVQVIEVSIPNLQNLAESFGISKSDENVISGVIKQYLSSSQSGTPYTFSIQAYNDKKSPQANSQNLYGTHATINSHSQYNPANYQQPNYYQQQPSYDYNNYNYKQQQHQREVEIYEQKLREYYAQYPWAAPQSATTTASPPDSELIKPNEIISPNPEPKPDTGKSLADLLLDNLGTTAQPSPKPNNQATDGKSEKHETTTTTTTSAPKKSLDDLIGNVFTEKPQKTSEEPPKQEVGKSLFELLSELKPSNEESSDEVKTKSDVAGGDYGLDVRTDDSKVKRTKRHILREGLRRITERISNFGKSSNERHTRDHDCNHHEGRSHHSHKHHHSDSDSDDENDDRQSGFIENHRHDKHKGRHPTDFENDGGHGHGHFNPFYPHEHQHPYSHQHPHPYPHPHPHPHPHPNTDFDQHEENKFRPNGKPRPPVDNENPVNQDTPQDETVQPSRKPNSIDAGTQTDPVTATNTEGKDPTLDIDIRGGFEETRRRRHIFKRSRRSPEDDGFVFQEDSDTTAAKDEVKTDNEEKKEPAEAEAEPTEENATEKEGEEGGLDNRFGLFGGFNRQPGRRPLVNLIGGVVNGFLGGADPYNRAPPPQPYYPDPYGQPQFGFNNYPPQQPVHIHINNVANANAQSQSTNTGGGGPFGGPHGSNQNAAANAQSENYQNQFGSFQNSGASGQASNLAADGSSGQLSAANAMNQNYQNEFGFGSKNAAQSQSANFDNHGNLALTSSNSGTNHFAGPNGAYDETNSAAQSSLQGQFGTQNSGAQSNTFQGPNGSGASASSQASSINNGHGAQNSGASAGANSGNFGGNSFGNAQSNTYANDQWGW